MQCATGGATQHTDFEHIFSWLYVLSKHGFWCCYVEQNGNIQRQQGRMSWMVI